MVNFFIILLTNLFTGVVLYLVLTLKLEKSSSDYSQKKYKREIEDMMREFNNSAERNISLLENRLQLMQKLLKVSGKLDSIDVRTIDTTNQTEVSSGKVQKHVDQKHTKNDYNIVKTMNDTSLPESSHDFLVDEELTFDAGRIEDDTFVTNENQIIEETLKNGAHQHDAFVQLYNRGFTPEKISQSSGVTVPEIMLILELNGVVLNREGDLHGI